MKPVPVPAKYLYPYVGSQVLKGTGQGQPKMTLGLPVLITIHNNYIIIQPVDNCHSYDGHLCSPTILVENLEIPKVILTGWWTSETYLFTTCQVDGHSCPDRWCTALLWRGAFQNCQECQLTGCSCEVLTSDLQCSTDKG
jgi:hypothetical protein